ncbi:MAG: hypothetical protein ACE14Q_01470 [Acidobacteriota bacterium]
MFKKLFILFLVLFSVALFSQQSVKIKPIVGKHSYNLQSIDVGYGIKKHTLCLERIPDKSSEFYLPSNLNLEVDAHPFNQPPNSNKLKINSQKTADGFLFVSNGPQGNNLHLHLKKSASENSSYEIELNLTRGKKYQFKVDYVLNGYLLIAGETGNYYEMIDLLSSNNYYLEALSLIDDELLKYQGDEQLNWWAEAIVGLFGDLVDVEAIGLIDNNANYFIQMMEGYSSETSPFSIAYWTCGESEAMAKLWQGIFLVISSNQECNFLHAPIMKVKSMLNYFHCKLSVCKDSLDPELCLLTCMPDDGGGEELAWDCGKPCYEQTDMSGKCKACCTQCHSGTYDKCVANCQAAGVCLLADFPCYLCDIPVPPPPY